MDEQSNSDSKISFQDRIKKYGLVFFEFAKITLVALVIILPIRYFLFQPFIVSGESMAPSFSSGDYLIVDEISYRFSDPKRGDVVVFYFPKNESQRFIKRIIGLPGEKVEINNGVIAIINGEDRLEIKESYLPGGLLTYGQVDIELQDNEYFVLGDNRTQSYDSRIWGVLPGAEIIGKTVLRLFPLSAISVIERPAY